MNGSINGARLVVRADADASIGCGHVMRCLALAQEWQARGGDAVFAGRVTSPLLRQRLAGEGFGFVEIADPFPRLRDLHIMEKVLQETKNKETWVAVDGYHFSAAYTRALRAAGAWVLQIDDHGHQEEYEADILLNHNPGGKEMAYPLSGGGRTLLGPRYFLLRREFLEHRQARSARFLFPARHLLLTMGGADPDNVTALALAALDRAAVSGVTVKVVVGAANGRKGELAAMLEGARYDGEVVSGVEDMAPFMAWADMAVCAGGVTSVELAFMGVPSLIVSLAGNQDAGAVALEAAGAARFLGRASDLTLHHLATAIREMACDADALDGMRESGQRVVDGEGARRVVDAMWGLPGRLRAAVAADCDLLLAWANDPAVRAASFHGAIIGRAEHRQWLARKLEDENAVLWIAETNAGAPAGVVRFEISGREAVMSIALDARFRGQGFGHFLIRRACERIMGEKQLLEQVTALVKKENFSSIRAFQNAGFRMVGRAQINGCQAVRLVLNQEAVQMPCK